MTKILKLTNGGINWKWQNSEVHLASGGILTCSDYYGWKIIEKPLISKSKTEHYPSINSGSITSTDATAYINTEPDLGTYFLATKHQPKQHGGIAGPRVRMFSETLDGIMWKINQLQYVDTNTNTNGVLIPSKPKSTPPPRPKPQVYGRG
ncbi:MAG: hypothetical protein LBM97_02255 [Candidatus Nomurabacteria bacterium]|jgi:hypothetical protein|nr:hypothetical protein [Candidatus Nomurabacteria bacterium]